jgi:hypothetical protein
MTMNSPQHTARYWLEKLYKWVFPVLLLLLAFNSYLEVSKYLTLKRQREFLISADWRTYYLYFLVFNGLGVILGVITTLAPRMKKPISLKIGWIGWLLSSVLMISIIWFHLYAPWQRAYFGIWSQALLILGGVSWIDFIINTDIDTQDNRKTLVMASGLLIYVRIVMELRKTGWVNGYRAITIIGALMIFSLLLIAYGPFTFKRIRDQIRKLASWQRLTIATVLLLSPFGVLFMIGPEGYFNAPVSRLGLFLITTPLVVTLISDQHDKPAMRDWVAGISLISAMLTLALVVAFAVYEYDYPFSLSWSEGNRFYDYSLIFASKLYNYPGKLVVPYFDPGRYGLWGIVFLLPQASIGFHRLWNLLLKTGLPFLLGWTSGYSIKDWRLRLAFALGIYFFTAQVGIYAPLIISLTLVIAASRLPSISKRGLVIAIASLYAGISRQTWAAAAGIWGGLADVLLYYRNRKGGILEKLWPTFLLVIVGTVPGAIGNWGKLSDLATGTSLPTSQPLLWYRLLPNATYGYGILLGTVIITGPILLLLAWLIASRTWDLDLLQKIAVVSACLILFIFGAVVSTKIGGGSNLHNLDMFSGTLILVTAVAVERLVADGKFRLNILPVGLQGILIFYAVLSLAPMFGPVQYDRLPSQEEVDKALHDIRWSANHYIEQGEVLFMDQRQLVTFGYMGNIPFVPEYEKKYMMDQAMASDANYFTQYYKDLARKRFSLIITEPLKLDLVNWGEDESFGEENDAWVKWISEPTLCFYRPIATYTKMHVQLLVPQEDVSDCLGYLR